MGRGVDAAIFGSGAVTYIAAAMGGGDQPCRSHVARESAAFRLLLLFFPCSLFEFFFLFFSVSLDPTRSEEKEIQSETRRNFGCCHAQLYENRRRKEGSLTHTFG